jgi:hypothetical protein
MNRDIFNGMWKELGQARSGNAVTRAHGKLQ